MGTEPESGLMHDDLISWILSSRAFVNLRNGIKDK